MTVYNKKIAVIGLGKLGLPFAVTLARNGNYVLGIDNDENRLDELAKNKIHFHEAELYDAYKDNREKLKFTDDYYQLLNTQAAVILVNTPSNKKGDFSNEYVEGALTVIGKVLYNWEEKYPYTIIISSTVMPGSIENSFIPMLERNSGKKLNKDFNICYMPSLIALGSVIQDLEHPDLVMIGASNDDAFTTGKTIWSTFAKTKNWVQLSLPEAEIAKISLNAYVTMKISFANFIGNLCDKFDGNVNASLIAEAIGKDKRVSPYYFTPGLAFGGPCFPRDTKAFIKFAKNHNLDASHIKATQHINDTQNNALFYKVKALKKKKIAILGLDYAANSSVTIESPAMFLINTLLSSDDYKIHVYDPLAMGEAEKELGNSVTYHYSAEDACKAADCAVVTTMHPEFKPLLVWATKKKDYPVIDCWNYLSNKHPSSYYPKQNTTW